VQLASSDDEMCIISAYVASVVWVDALFPSPGNACSETTRTDGVSFDTSSVVSGSNVALHEGQPVNGLDHSPEHEFVIDDVDRPDSY
jgi:hypothetical protein